MVAISSDRSSLTMISSLPRCMDAVWLSLEYDVISACSTAETGESLVTISVITGLYRSSLLPSSERNSGISPISTVWSSTVISGLNTTSTVSISISDTDISISMERLDGRSEMTSPKDRAFADIDTSCIPIISSITMRPFTRPCPSGILPKSIPAIPNRNPSGADGVRDALEANLTTLPSSTS